VGRSKDVGVDTNNFYPYAAQEIIIEMQNVPVALSGQEEKEIE